MNVFKQIAAVLVIAAALLFLQRSMHPRPPDDQYLPAVGLGQVLAGQAVKAVNGYGKVVLVFMPLHMVENQTLFESFQKDMSKSTGVQLAVRTVVQAETYMGALQFERFAAIMRENAKADAIVFCVGANSFTDAQMTTLSESAPKLIVMNWDEKDVERGMNSRLLRAAVNRRSICSNEDHPRTPQQWFDHYYTLVTAP